jgi:N-methylhydantoinase A
MDAAEVAEAPIHLINSGPSMAPVSGRHFARVDESADTAVVADTGGTTFDVSLVRRGNIPWTRETWIGQPYRGHMTGFPSVDVKSIGAGGGSIAWLDDGGLLHVGPTSAGAVPGPACYGKGGTEPTVTDAALVLGYLDADFFLGGTIKLDVEAARMALAARVADPLGLAVEAAAVAVISVATENMVQAIVDITVAQGIDPRTAVLVGGGGAAGLNSAEIGRRLGCQSVIIPEVGAALSAAGAMMSDLTSTWRRTFFASSDRFDFAGVNAVLDQLEAQCHIFIEGPGKASLKQVIEFVAEARYRDQVWEIEVPLPMRRFRQQDDLAAFVENFHRAHESVFAVRDTGSVVEVVSWTASVRCQLREAEAGTLVADAKGNEVKGVRQVYFAEEGWLTAAVHRFETIDPGDVLKGPAIVESPFTSIVLNPGTVAQRRLSGSLSIRPSMAGAAGMARS